jgi:hypothetical protein
MNQLGIPSHHFPRHKQDVSELVCSVSDLLYISNLSMTELALRIGKQPKDLLGWVHNTIQVFDFEMLARLCAIFTFPDRSGTLHPLPPSLLLELRTPAIQQEIRFVFSTDSDGHLRPLALPVRTIPQVSALERLPEPFQGQIVCHLHMLMQSEALTYAQLSREMRASGNYIGVGTLSELARGKTESIWRPTLLALCNRFGGVSRLFSYTTPPVGSDH